MRFYFLHLKFTLRGCSFPRLLLVFSGNLPQNNHLFGKNSTSLFWYIFTKLFKNVTLSKNKRHLFLFQIFSNNITQFWTIFVHLIKFSDGNFSYGHYKITNPSHPLDIKNIKGRPTDTIYLEQGWATLSASQATLEKSYVGIPGQVSK